MQNTVSLYTDTQTPQICPGLTLYLWTKGKVHRVQQTFPLHKHHQLTKQSSLWHRATGRNGSWTLALLGISKSPQLQHITWNWIQDWKSTQNSSLFTLLLTDWKHNVALDFKSLKFLYNLCHIDHSGNLAGCSKDSFHHGWIWFFNRHLNTLHLFL